MSILDYANPVALPRRPWWLVAIAAGLVIGGAAGNLAYEPLLRGIVGQVQLISGINDYFSAWIRFVAMAGASGALIGCCSVAVAGRRRMWLGWPIEFAIVYTLGAAAGLMCARAEWLSKAAVLNSFVAIAAAQLPPTLSANLPVQASFQLKDVPAVTVPICGCAAVMLVLGLTVSIRWIFAAANRLGERGQEV